MKIRPVVYVNCSTGLRHELFARNLCTATVVFRSSFIVTIARKAEFGGGSGPYTTEIVSHTFTVGIDLTTCCEGLVDGFGSADAGNQCESLHRETRIESHVFAALRRDNALFFTARVDSLSVKMSVASSRRLVIRYWQSRMASEKLIDTGETCEPLRTK